MKTFYLSVIILLAAACTYLLIKANDDKDDGPSALQRIISDSLYSLSIKASVFDTLPHKQDIVFSFSLNFEGKLTLNGWSKIASKGETQFEDNSMLTLDVSGNALIALKKETVFNNIILNVDEIEKVKKAITNPKEQCVLFTPDYLPGQNNLMYNISVIEKCDETSQPLHNVAFMNPSPPKQYNFDN